MITPVMLGKKLTFSEHLALEGGQKLTYNSCVYNVQLDKRKGGHDSG